MLNDQTQAIILDTFTAKRIALLVWVAQAMANDPDLTESGITPEEMSTILTELNNLIADSDRMTRAAQECRTLSHKAVRMTLVKITLDAILFDLQKWALKGRTEWVIRLHTHKEIRTLDFNPEYKQVCDLKKTDDNRYDDININDAERELILETLKAAGFNIRKAGFESYKTDYYATW